MANIIWTPQFEDEIDHQFILRVQNEVTQSCALPFAVPIERIPEFIIQSAQYFWQNCDLCAEERYYMIKNADICKGNKLNKIAQLPQQILGVHGVYKMQSNLKYGAMGDFSIERMMMSSYSMFGGAGTVGGGFGINGLGYNLSDVITSMYEVDTFNQTLNAPLTFFGLPFSKKVCPQAVNAVLSWSLAAEEELPTKSPVNPLSDLQPFTVVNS